MIWSFLLAFFLAVVSYLLGAYLVKVTIYTGMAKVVVLLVLCWGVYWLYRRISRGRRGGVRQIPRL